MPLPLPPVRSQGPVYSTAGRNRPLTPYLKLPPLGPPSGPPSPVPAAAARKPAATAFGALPAPAPGAATPEAFGTLPAPAPGTATPKAFGALPAPAPAAFTPKPAAATAFGVLKPAGGTAGADVSSGFAFSAAAAALARPVGLRPTSSGGAKVSAAGAAANEAAAAANAAITSSAAGAAAAAPPPRPPPRAAALVRRQPGFQPARNTPLCIGGAGSARPAWLALPSPGSKRAAEPLLALEAPPAGGDEDAGRAGVWHGMVGLSVACAADVAQRWPGAVCCLVSRPSAALPPRLRTHRRTAAHACFVFAAQPSARALHPPRLRPARVALAPARWPSAP